jgi:hypothetical protein
MLDGGVIERGVWIRVLDFVVLLVHILVYGGAMVPSERFGGSGGGRVWLETLHMPLVSGIR